MSNLQAIGDAWAREMAVDRAQEWADTQVARTVMREQLDGIRYAHAELARELRKYPLREGSAHLRDVPISRDGHLPARLDKLMREANAESDREFWRALGSMKQGHLPAVVDGAKLVGTRGEWALSRAASTIFKTRLQAPERMPMERRRQAAVDAMYAPEPAPQDARRPGGWRF